MLWAQGARGGVGDAPREEGCEDQPEGVWLLFGLQSVLPAPLSGSVLWGKILLCAPSVD